MTQKIVHTSPSDNWFFVFFDEGKPILMPVATWATWDNGDVTGLIGEVAEMKDRTTRLITPPPVPRGVYKHLNQLSEDELRALGSGWQR